MNNELHCQLGEMELGKVKTSLVVDENLWKDFSIIVIQNEGNRKKNGEKSFISAAGYTKN